MSRWMLSRRALLGGAGAAVGLPILEAMLPDVLRQVPDLRPLADRDVPHVRDHLPRHHPEQRRLPRPGRPAEPDPLPLVTGQVQFVEDDALPEGLLDVGQCDD